MAELHETMMGKKFFEGDIPRIAKALEEIAKALTELNKKKRDECIDAHFGPEG